MTSASPGHKQIVTNIDRLAAQIAARQHGVFSAVQLPGITKAMVHTRITSGRWKPIQREVFVIAGSAESWEQRLWIGLLRAGCGAVVCSRAAIALHHVKGMGRGPIDILQPECSVPNAKATTSRRTTSLPQWQVTVVDGLPVTTVARSLFDLAGLASPTRRRNGWAYLTEKTVERLLDNAITQGLVSERSLMRVFLSLAGRGRPGTRLMRDLLEGRSGKYVATDSELEDAFVKLVVDHDLPTPMRQVRLGSADHLIGKVDFYYDEAKLIVEADSVAFHLQRAQMLADHQRDLELMASGWRVLRLDWWQVTNDRPRTADLLRRILDRRTSA